MPPVDGTGNGGACGLDTSLTFESAFVLVPDTDATDTICPRKDQDFWRLDLGAGELVTFDVKYDKLADMQLGVDWYGPVGACMPAAPTTCTGATDCPGQTCDAPRGGCRRTAPGESCVSDTDCLDGEHCVGAPVKLGSPLVSRREAAGSATVHRVTGSVGSVMAGAHYLVVYDAKDTLADASTKYHLSASVVADPDAREVNDTKNLARPLTSGQAVDGFLSRSGVAGTPGDVDWYVITPPGGAQQVVTVELTSPKASGAAPSWTLYQGAQSYPSTKHHELGTADGTLVVRASALVMPDPSAPIYLQVSDTGGGADPSKPYHLTVTLAADASEPTRDDAPDTAQTFAAGAPASGATHTFTGTIVAENDQDWYRIDTAAAPTDRSLLYLAAQAPWPADILLQVTTFMPSTQSCTQDSDCTAGPEGAPSGRCLASHKCLVGLLQRPAFDVVGDPQLGGLTPNYIESQQPILTTGTGAIYVLVTHNAATTLAVAGYGAAEYSLALVHKAEPDGEDATNPDNKFVSRPLLPNLNEGDFRAHRRTVTTTVSGGTGGVAYVALGVPSGQSGTYAVAGGGCVTVPLLAFNAAGAPATGTTTVTLAASDATAALSSTCGGAAAPSPYTITGAAGSVGYTPGATAGLTTLTATVGGVAATQAMTTVAAGTAGISFVAGSATLPRRLPVMLRSPTPVRLQLATPVTGTRTFALDTGGKANIVCHTAVGSACPGSTGVTNPCGTALSGAGAKTACQVAITSGQTYDLDLVALSPGLVILTGTDTAATGALAPATFVATATTAQGLTTATASGYISYEGDEDFFTIPIGNFPIAGLTLTVDMAASPVDLRVNAARYDPEYQTDRGSSARAVACDDPLLCAVDDCASRTCASPGTCNSARKTCDQPVMHQSNGPAGTPAQCVWVAPGSPTIEVRVNDMQSNDWDEVRPYSFTVQLTEGCPAQCAGAGYSCTP